MNNPFDKILNWYFTKNALPYWCILLIDCAVLGVSGLMVYWFFHDSDILLTNLYPLLNTLVCFIVLTLVGFRIFHTYSGFMRYSSFVDLVRVMYSNSFALGLALVAQIGMDYLPAEYFVHFGYSKIILLYLIATLIMWALRVLVKTLYDVAFSDSRALHVLIYGAMSEGVELAKSIRVQRPRKYVVKGFITDSTNTHHQRIMGEKVYSIEEDIASIISENKIEGVLVSPYRTKDFRYNQDFQDAILGAGAKILMAQNAIEMNTDEEGKTDLTNIQMREVSVEELLPRSEIRVDMKSVGELLTGKRVLITGSAGSIGSEIVRQVAQLQPAAMLLIDQAETPQHDVRLMMQKDFPDIPAEILVTSICHSRRMEGLFSEFRPACAHDGG